MMTGPAEEAAAGRFQDGDGAAAAAVAAEEATSWPQGAAARGAVPPFAGPMGCGCVGWTAVLGGAGLDRPEGARVETWRAESGDHGRACSRSVMAASL